MTPLAYALAGSAALCALPVAEIAARQILGRGGYYRYIPNFRVHMELDRDALPALDPVARFYINEDGERGGPAPKPGEDVFRALVIGGSAAECYFLDQARTWAAVVERELNEPEALAALGAPRAHVGNISRAIVPCSGLCTILERSLPRYPKLDLILIMTAASDLVKWLEQKMPATMPPAALPTDALFEQHPEHRWGLSLKRSASWALLARTRRRLLAPVARTHGDGAWMHRVRQMRARAERLIDRVDDPSPPIEAFDTHFRRLIAIAKSKSPRVIVARQPWFEKDYTSDESSMFWNFGLGRPYKEEVKVYIDLREVRRLMRLMDETASAAARDMGVEQIDLMPVIEHSTRSFYDLLHFTPAGAEAVGAAVAKAIIERG